MRRFYKWGLVALCLLGAWSGQAQINDGGSQPYSLSASLITKQLPTATTPALDMKKVLEEDGEEEKKGGFMRIGRAIPMNLNLRQVGAWEDLPGGGQICRLRIESPGALGINLYFSDFRMPKGAKLHVYTPDYKRILGGYTDFNNHPDGLFATEHLDGDALVVEYYEPAAAAGTGAVVIGEVGHIYKTGAFGSSGSCEVNVNCTPEGTGKTQQRDAVARILVKVGAQQGYCTGSMVNNVRQDCTPYFLTALHCGTNGAGNLTTAADLNQWIFYFNYQSAGCPNGTKPTPNTITGGVARAHSNDGGGNTGSDFLLLQLNNQPQSAWNVFYAGWNRNNTAATGGYGIHHPAGDIKKISTFTGTLVSTTWGGSTPNTHWRVTWVATTNGHGVTEGGSSGSPLFNTSGQIVGTLTGGSSFCTALNSPDQYGKMSYHWDQNGTAANRRLRDWLDPDNTGATTLAGVYHPCVVHPNDAGIVAIINPAPGSSLCTNPFIPEVQLRNYGTANLTSVNIRYQINNDPPSTFAWTGNLASNATANVTLPSVTGPGGAFTFRAFTNLPNGAADPNTSNDTSSAATQIVTAIALPYSQPFNSGAMPANITVFPTTDTFQWKFVSPPTATGSGAGFGSARFDNYSGTSTSNPDGTLDWMILPTFNMTNAVNTKMTFAVAHARYNTTRSDSLIVAVATNCSPTYTVVYIKGGNTLATAPNTTANFVPTTAQWRVDTVDLAAYQGQGYVSIAFINKSNWGNNIYVDNINITSSCNITTTTNTTAVACFGASTGSATVTPSGGVAPYTYSWSGGQTTATINNVAAGVYTVTVSDAASCTATATVTVTQPAAALSATNTKTNVLCFGGSTGSITVTATGGTSPYTYNRGTGAQASNSFTGLPAGNYTVTVTDANGCTATTAANITQPASALSATNTKTNVSCFGGSTGGITVTAAGGTSPYTYNRGTGAQASNIFTGLSAGNYTVTVTDANGCTATTAANITQPASALSATATPTATTCAGNNGAVSLAVSGGTAGYTYLWSSGQTTSSISGLAPGGYSYTVTDANGCTVTGSSIVLNGCSACSINATSSSNNPTCHGASNGSATITPTTGTAPYTFVWSNGAGNNGTASGLAAGSYSVTVSDNLGCTATASFTLTNPPLLQASIGGQQNVSCFGGADGSLTASATGGTGGMTYMWSNGSTTATNAGLSAACYTVTTTDANGCTAVAGPVCVTEPSSAVSVTLNSSNASCGGVANGTAIAAGAGGSTPYTYQWSNSATGAGINGLLAGSYTVTVSDANGCTATGTTTVGNAGGVAASISTTINVLCFGASTGGATAVGAGGTQPYTFVWDNGNTSASIVNIAAGSYMVTVTDADGCSSTAKATILQPASAVSVTASGNDPSSAGNDGTASATGSGGTPPYGYLWSNGATTQNLSGLTDGQYTVTVTDANGCTATASVTLVLSSLIDLPAAVQQFQVLPNPSSGQFVINIQLAQPQTASVRLTDVLGRVLRQWDFQQSAVQIPVDIAEQADGVYFVNLITQGGQATVKVVLSKP